MEKAKDMWRKSDKSMKAVVIIVILVIIILIILIIIRRTMLRSKAEEGSRGASGSSDSNSSSSDSRSDNSRSDRSDSSSSSDSRPRAANPEPIKVTGSKGVAATQPTCGTGNCNEDKNRVQASIQNSISRNQTSAPPQITSSQPIQHVHQHNPHAHHHHHVQQAPIQVENSQRVRTQKGQVRFQASNPEEEAQNRKEVSASKPRRFMNKNDD